MSRRLRTFCNKARHAWAGACKGDFGADNRACSGHSMDASLAKALDAVEEENLAWVMQFHSQGSHWKRG